MKKMKKNKFIKMFSFIIVPVLALVFGVSLLIGNNSEREVHAVSPSTWQATWQYWRWNTTSIQQGRYIWTDGSNYYYSNSANQFVLDISTYNWSSLTWSNSPSSFSGVNVWTDRSNFYYSSGGNNYLIDVVNHSFTSVSFTGLTSITGSNVWTDGSNIYYSNNYNQYIFDSSTLTWTSKSWTGLTSFVGSNVWTDGSNYYYSNSADQYVLDVSTSTWTSKSWTGLTSFVGSNVVIIDGNVFYINVSSYVLDVATSTWSVYTWNFDNNISIGVNGNFYGQDVYFIDGVAYFFSGNINGYMTLRLVMSNSGSGGDEPVYSFNGNNVDVATDLRYVTTGNNTGLMTSGLISFVSCQFNFDYDDVNDIYKIYFTLDYLRNYRDSNTIFGYRQAVSTFDWFSNTGINFNGNTVFSFVDTDLGSSKFFYAMDSNTYNDLIVDNQNINYKNAIVFTIYISSGFTSYNFTGVRFFSDYVISGNYYYIQNHVRYFDVNDEYIDISLPVTSQVLSDAYVLSNRYYYFNQSQNGGSDSQAFDNGYAAGLQDGETNGYNSGYTDGQTAGYTAGQQYANDVLVPNAYQNGYAAGELYGASHANEYTFYGLISAVIDAPISYMTSLFNFNILGVNMLGFITGILTLAVVLFVIKFIV